MAISADDLARLRRGVCKDMHPAFTKTQLNTALQQGKDWITSNKTSAAAAITDPAFNAAKKKKIFAYLFELQFTEDKS